MACFNPIGKSYTFKSVLFLIILLICFGCQRKGYHDYENEAYETLEKILAETKDQLAFYGSEMQQQASKARHDEVVNSFFKAKRDYYYLSKDTVLPYYIESEIQKLKQKIRHYYLMNYLDFYDILFVDTKGEIFYTIRKEKDYHNNIFEGEMAETGLSKRLKQNPGESFVDFQFYNISGEPSAFFIEPVMESGNIIGWLVLQCAINNINDIFTSSSQLGKTGEVVLVNKEHYLLTNSRFKAEQTILKLQLPRENIKAKFKEKNGRKAVVDYRGKHVLSAFETYSFLGCDWLIIAKIDRGEVVKTYYQENKDHIYPNLQKNITMLTYEKVDDVCSDSNKIHVDMSEYARVDTACTLFTQGVSTCTAIIVTYPDRFSYMAHVSPYDLIYGQDKTDIVNRMFNKFALFEITQSELRNLEFYIVSTQNKSYKNLIDIILKNGCYLSQIKIIEGKGMDYANLCHVFPENKNLVCWKPSKIEAHNAVIDFSTVETLEEMILGF